MAWFDTGEAMGALNAIGRDANNFIKRTIEEIEKDLARVEVNVGAPGIRFGQSRNGNNPGTSDGGPMGSETKVKKAMACEGCAAKFSVWRRKRECLGCKQLYCSQCLPKVVATSGSGTGGWCSRERRQATCSKCIILLAYPPSRSALLGLRTRDLQAFLASRKVPTHGCLEKDDLVNLIIQLSNYEVNGDARVSLSQSEGQFPSRNQNPPSADSERRGEGETLPRGDADGIPPSVHSFASRNEVCSPTTAPRENSLPTSPSRLSPRAFHRSQLPPEGNTWTIDESVRNPGPPPVSQSGQTSHSGSQFQVNPPPSSADDGDWVMVDLEERQLPPYSAVSATSPPSPPSPPPTIPVTEPSLPRRGDVESEPPASRDEGATPEPSPPISAEDNSSPPTEGAGATSVPPSATPVVNISTASNSEETEDSAQSSPAANSPLFNRTSASQGSSPSKGTGPFQMPRDIASSILSSTTSEDDLSSLTIKQLKELLTSSRVDYRGCCEKKELLERAQRLWREYKAASHENISDDTMCKVCMDAAIDCVMLECGHMATCTPCGKRMSECPICRQYVIRIVRTFKA